MHLAELPQAGASNVIDRRDPNLHPLNFDDAVVIVALVTGVVLREMKGRKRGKKVKEARDMLASIARERCGMSFPEIAQAMGRKSHTWYSEKRAAR